jgi:hypothetical protein
MSIDAIKVAQKALERQHHSYGEIIQIVKYMPSATGGIYRQRKKMYEAPFEIKASVAREPEEEMISRIGESSQREAKVTIPISFLKEYFGKSTPVKDMLTTSDLIILDNRVWRITQSALTGRIGTEPLLVYLILREKLGEKETDYA